MTELNPSINKLTKNPIVKLIGLITIVSSTIVAVGIYITSNYYANKINELESNIERLTPSSGNSNSIDLSSFFVFRNDILNENIPKNSKFDDENLFYYSDDKYWEYKQMNPIEFINFINDKKSQKEEKEYKDHISHVWYSDFSIDLNHPQYEKVIENEQSSLIADSTSNAYLILYNKKPNKISQYIKLTRFNNDKSFLKRRDATKDFITIDSVSYRDLGFKYLSSSFIDMIFNDLFSELPNSIAFTELSNISLKDNWLFISSLSVFGNKNINKGKPRNVYCFNEWYILYTELNTFILEVQTPSFEPIRRGEQFAELNNWLSYFRVVVK